MDSNAPVVTEAGQPQSQLPEPPAELVTIRADELAQLRTRANVLAVLARSSLIFLGLIAILTTIIVIVAVLAD